MKKLLDAFNAGGCLLQVFDLLLDGLQGRGEHPNVVHKQVGRANSDLMLEVEVCSHGQPDRVADDVEEVGAEEGQIAHKPRAAMRFKQAAQKGEQEARDVCLRSCGANILHAGQVLLQEAIKAGVGPALAGPLFDGYVLQQAQDHKGQNAVKGERDSRTPVLAPEEQQDAGDQERVAQHLDDEL